MTMGASHSRAEEPSELNDAEALNIWVRKSLNSRQETAESSSRESLQQGHRATMTLNQNALLLEASRLHGIPIKPSPYTSKPTSSSHDEDGSKSTSVSSSMKGSPGCFPLAITKTAAGTRPGWFRRAKNGVFVPTAQDPSTSITSSRPPQQILLQQQPPVKRLSAPEAATFIQEPAASPPVPTPPTQRSNTLPIPHKRTTFCSTRTDTQQQHHAAVEEDDAENLKRIYDMRTWDMYLRITEARKRSSYQQESSSSSQSMSNMIPHHQPYMTSTSPNHHHLHGAYANGDNLEDEGDDQHHHELFFGDMD